MKFSLISTLLLSLSLTAFAANSHTVLSGTCITIPRSKLQLCSRIISDEPKVYAYAVKTESGAIEVRSDKIYEGVEPVLLSKSLERIILVSGISESLAAYIAGPVVSNIQFAVENPNNDEDLTLASIERDLALRISKQK
jgi:hypothetical protein